MGGHGAYNLALHSPDAIIGLVATAGWNVKEHYADSNKFFMNDVAAPAPAAKAILEATTEDGNALLAACNVGGGRKVHLRVGARDAAVPPWQVRKMARVMQRCGADVTYEEVEGKVCYRDHARHNHHHHNHHNHHNHHYRYASVAGALVVGQ
jgi:hypothetical protein